MPKIGETCGTCEKIFCDALNIMSIENTGECLGCDHLRGEDQEQHWTGEEVEEYDEQI